MNSPDDYLPPDLYQQVAGYEKMLAFFGYWPSFHDAEVVSLCLERRGKLDSEGPVASLQLLTREWRQDAATGRTLRGPDGLVEFRFTAVDDLHIVGFNYQNAIHSLDLRRERTPDFPARWQMFLRPAFGVDGAFSCQEAEVVGVTPAEPDTLPPGP